MRCGSWLEDVAQNWHRNSSISQQFQRLMGGALDLLEGDQPPDEFDQAVAFIAETLENIRVLLQKHMSEQLDPDGLLFFLQKTVRQAREAELQRALGWFQEGESLPDDAELQRLKDRLVNWRSLVTDEEKHVFWQWVYNAMTRWSRTIQW